MKSMAIQRLHYQLLVLVVVVALVVTPGDCIVDPNLPNIFYPFGDDEGDAIGPIRDDGFTPAERIPGGFPFFGSSNELVFVNLNGAFTFGVGYGSYTPTPFPIKGINVVAPYWADVDVRKNDGRLYYRSSTDDDLLTRASSDVRATFSSQCLDTFRATWIFIATWHGVTYFGGSSRTSVNSFQGILVTDGRSSFTIFNYGTLTWTTGTASGGNAATGLGGIAAQVGFNAGDGVTYYVVPASRTNAIVNIYQQSNVGVTGRWMFRVDLAQIGPTGCVTNPTTCTLDSRTGLCAGSATCSFQGDPHYKTFDNTRFNYQGPCKYLVAKPKVRSTALRYFEVYAKNELRYGFTTVSFARYAEIVYGADTIRFSRSGRNPNAAAVGVINVTVNGVPVSTPRCSCGSDYSIYLIGSFMRFITSFGLVVEYNGKSQVNVFVPPTYNANKLTGICGNFDGIAANDPTECNGRSYTGTKVDEFGHVCVVNDPEAVNNTSCPLPPAPSDPCLTNPLPEYVTRCEQLKKSDGPFASCIAQLDARQPGTSTQLYDDCILDACFSEGEAICDNVWSLVDECANLNFQIDCDAWQTSTNCPVTCPAGSGMVYDCNATSICHPTCNNPNVPATCTRPNRGACVCPVGTLLDNGVCTSTCLGGCVDNTGAFRQAGDSWLGPNCQQLNCTACPSCPSQFEVVATNGCPTNQVCVNSQCVSSTPGVCWCAGDPHCSTFDELFLINYQGICEYLLAGTIANQSSSVTDFRVYALNDHYFSPSSTAVSYVARVRLVIGSEEIKLERNFSIPWIPVLLSVNNVVESIPYNPGMGYTVHYAGLSVRIQTTFGVVVEYDGWTRVAVFVPPSYNNHLTGLCGNFDGNVTNDWTTADGSYVGDDPNGTNLLGDSFVVGSSTTCSEPAPPIPDDANCDQYEAISNLCTISIQASQECAIALGNDALDTFIAACILDGCLANSTLHACVMASQFFELCIQQNVSVVCSDWQSAGCDAIFASTTNGKCSSGLTYKCDAPACTATCDDPNAADECTLPNREGCLCPPGQLLSNGVCYATCPTGCMDGETLRPIGSTWTDPTTCATKTCVACATCYQGGNIQSTACSGSCVAGTCITEVATCTCLGDPHCWTFDNLFFSYQGVCKYNLASVTNGSTLPPGFSTFQIFARNEYRYGSTAVSYVKYVEIVLGELTIRLSRNLALVAISAAIPVTLTVSGQQATIPFGGPGSPFNVYYTGTTARFQTNFGLSVEYDGVWVARVFLPRTQYLGLVQGFCGNNDRITANDWILANGTNVAGNVNAEVLLGDSYVVANDPEVDPANPCPATLPPVPNPCFPVPTAHQLGCGIITNTTGPFADCVNTIGLTEATIVYNACLEDACYSNGTSICNSVRAFVSQCQQLGSPVSCQAFQLTPCAAKCPAGMKFQCAANTCPATCAEPDAPSSCTRPPADGCTCPNDQFLHNGRCTPTCPPGCVDSNLQFRQVGAVWRGQNCSVYTCVSQGTIRESSCLRNELCSSSNTCVRDETVCSCHGDPHCETFDRLFFDYQGICRYNLVSVKANAQASLPKFKIYSKNEHRYNITRVAFVKYVEIQLDGGDTIRLVGDFQSTNAIAVTALVNFNVVYPPYIGSGSSYSIKQYGSKVIFLTSFQLKIVFDGRWFFGVTIPRTLYSGQVYGLCGNNDGNATNDWTTANGTDVNGQPLAVNLLGDSFVVPDPAVTDPSSSCPAPPPAEPCSPTSPGFTTYDTQCSVLHDADGVFGNCIQLTGTDRATFSYDSCLLDACFTNGSSICASIKAAIDMCSALGVLIDSCTVLQSTGCDSVRSCPAGMTYQCNAPGCAVTCANPDPGPTCTVPSQDACVCPDGTFLLQGECVETCPLGCVDDKMQLRPIGAVWRGTGCDTYTCEACAGCAQGAQVVLATCGPREKCYRNRCIPASATCSCHGDPHCTTFDGRRIDYQGTCKYNLASVQTQTPGRPFFQVFSRNEYRFRATNVAFVKYVEIVYGGDTIRLVSDYLSKAAVQVNALLNGLPLSVANRYVGAGYIVSTYGRSLRYEAPSIGLVISLSAWKLEVNVSNDFAVLLNGLCGNFDGSANNDLRTATGLDVRNRSIIEAATLVGDSFVITDPEQPSVTAGQCPSPPPPTPCTPPAWVQDKCNILNNPSDGVFGPCLGLLGPAARKIIYDACILDACNTNGSSVCLSIKTVAEECNQLGFSIACDDWQAETDCGAIIGTCPVGMIYQCVTSGCQPTCDDPTANQNCAVPDTDGCVCPSGQLLLNGVCTSVCPSGCVDADGNVQQVGTSWLAGNCMRATCIACDECPLNNRIQLTALCCGNQQCVDETCVGGVPIGTLTPQQIAWCRRLVQRPIDRYLKRKCNSVEPGRRGRYLTKLCYRQDVKLSKRQFCNENGIGPIRF